MYANGTLYTGDPDDKQTDLCSDHGHTAGACYVLRTVCRMLCCVLHAVHWYCVLRAVCFVLTHAGRRARHRTHVNRTLTL
jgi:hypothetical protein